MERSDRHFARTRAFAFPPDAAAGRFLQTRFFRAEHGEICSSLVPAWNDLLAGLGALGPVAIITHNRHLRMAAIVPGLDFFPVPMSSAFVEMGSGLSVDSDDWHYGLAVENRIEGGAILGFQFFDRHGNGQLKLLLTKEARLECFLSTIEAYGVAEIPPAPVEESCEGEPPSCAVPDRSILRALWLVTRHETGGRYFAGLPGVTRLACLQSVGSDFARKISFDALLLALLVARKQAMPLRFHLFNRGLTHRATIVPRSMERCPHGLHLFDMASEFHFFEDDAECWVIRAGVQTDVELITADGVRLGMIASEGDLDQQAVWNEVLGNGF